MTEERTASMSDLEEQLFTQFCTPELPTQRIETSQGFEFLRMAIFLQALLDAKDPSFHITRSRLKWLVGELELEDKVKEGWIDRPWARSVQVDRITGQYVGDYSVQDPSKSRRGIADRGTARALRHMKKKPLDKQLAFLATEVYKKQQNEQQH